MTAATLNGVVGLSVPWVAEMGAEVAADLVPNLLQVLGERTVHNWDPTQRRRDAIMVPVQVLLLRHYPRIEKHTAKPGDRARKLSEGLSNVLIN